MRIDVDGEVGTVQEDPVEIGVVAVAAGDYLDPYALVGTRIGKLRRQGYFAGSGPLGAAHEGDSEAGFLHRRDLVAERRGEDAALAVEEVQSMGSSLPLPPFPGRRRRWRARSMRATICRP